MNYRKAYLHLFNQITDIIETLAKLDYDTEQVDTLLRLKAIQAEAKKICTER